MDTWMKIGLLNLNRRGFFCLREKNVIQIVLQTGLLKNLQWLSISLLKNSAFCARHSRPCILCPLPVFPLGSCVILLLLFKSNTPNMPVFAQCFDISSFFQNQGLAYFASLGTGSLSFWSSLNRCVSSSWDSPWFPLLPSSVTVNEQITLSLCASGSFFHL